MSSAEPPRDRYQGHSTSQRAPSLRERPPLHHNEDPDKWTIALFGKKPDFLRKIENLILRGSNSSVTNMKYFIQGENELFRIIQSQHFFEEEYQEQDQMIIDFMALSDPGPHQFILATDSQNAQEILNQIKKLEKIFGKHLTKYITIILENQKSYNLLRQMREMSTIRMAVLKENLDDQCKEWCSQHQSFQFDYKDYSQSVVKRQKKKLRESRTLWNPPYNTGSTGAHHENHSSSHEIASHAEKPSVKDKESRGSRRGVFSIILLGATGTGKSTSANTILTAGKPHRGPGQPFESYPGSTPVTTRCEEKVIELFGTEVRVVDTPDFFYEEERVDQAQIEECKKYCQEGHCVVLLVIQLGRFTDGERGILEKLENHLGWRIRESTIVLFTHGEDLKNSVDDFIGQRSYLKHIVEACGRRYHVFKNSSKDSKQVKTLIKGFPDHFPTFPNLKSSIMFCLK